MRNSWLALGLVSSSELEEGKYCRVRGQRPRPLSRLLLARGAPDRPGFQYI
jgi:hypothetical protein